MLSTPTRGIGVSKRNFRHGKLVHGSVDFVDQNVIKLPYQY
jgi:hypothetical protein